MLDSSRVPFFKALLLWILELNQNKEYIINLQGKSDKTAFFRMSPQDIYMLNLTLATVIYVINTI